MSGRRRSIFVTLVVALCTIWPQPASAKPFGYQLSPEELHPPKKPIGVFTDGRLSHAMGTYSTSLPIFVPPGRNGHTPSLALEYRSDGSRTMFGIGWEIPLDHVRRSLRSGTPRYDGPTGDPADDEFEFRLGDQTGTLVFSGSENGFLLYRPKIEGAFAKFYYDAKGLRWIVQDTAGRTLYLGETHSGHDAEYTGGPHDPSDMRAQIFAWYVERIVDPYQNVIRFEYSADDGSLWPTRVSWDLRENVTSKSHPYVEFLYDTKKVSPTTVTFRKGWRSALDARRLTAIEVHAFDETGQPLVRTTKVEQGAQQPGQLRNTLRVTPDKLPPAELQYFDPSPGLPTGKEIVVPSTPTTTGPYTGPEVRGLQVTHIETIDSDKLHYTKSMLVDIDGDGRPDQLLYAPSAKYGIESTYAKYWWRRNIGWAFEDAVRLIEFPENLLIDPDKCPQKKCWVIPCRTSLKCVIDTGTEIYTRQDVLDINGDGKADFVYTMGAGTTAGWQIFACLGNGKGVFGTPGPLGKCTLWTQASPSMLSTYHLATTRTLDYGKFLSTGLDLAGLIDLNGDGLPDYLRPADEGRSKVLQVYINRGMATATEAHGFVPGGYVNAGWMKSKGDRVVVFFRSYTLGDPTAMMMDLRDVNGDGLVDRVTAGAKATAGAKDAIVLGSGPSPFAYFDPTAKGYSYENNAHIVQASSKPPGMPSSNDDTQGAGLYDVNGDGMLDAVTWTESAGYRVQLNEGWGFGAQQSLAVAPGLLAGLSVTHTQDGHPVGNSGGKWVTLVQALIDFDGDGRLDLVRGSSDPVYPTSPVNWQAATIATDTGPAYRLRQMKAGQAKTALSYALPTQRPPLKTAIRNWVVNSLVETDTATGDSRKKTLTVEDPVWDHVRREFRGHQFVRVSEASGQRYEEHHYHTDEYNHGREFLLDTAVKPVCGVRAPADVACDDKPARRVATEWEAKEFLEPGDGKRQWVRVKRVMTAITDTTGCSKTETAYVYHDNETWKTLGLLAKVIRRGFDGSSADDDRVTVYDYWVHPNTGGLPSSSNLLLATTREQSIWSGAGNLTSKTNYYYDDMCPVDTANPRGALTQGRLCETHVWRGEQHATAVTTTTYDDHGRLLNRADPDNVVTKYTYYSLGGDPLPLLKETTNLLGHKVQYSKYHALSGQAQRVCGPQYVGTPPIYKCDEFSFDIHGRPFDTWRAMESLGSYSLALVESYRYDDGSASLPANVQHTRYPDPLNEPTAKIAKTAYFNRWAQVAQEDESQVSPCGSRSFHYDQLGRLQKAWLPWSNSACSFVSPIADSSLDYYAYEHDVLDRPTALRHKNLDEVKITYRGQLTDVRDERGYTTHYDDTGFDEVASISRQLSGRIETSSFVRDAAGRIIRATDENGGVYTYAYYGDGSLERATLPTGQYSYTRTQAGRLKRLDNPNGEGVAYEHDGIGRPKSREFLGQIGSCTADSTRLDVLSYDGETRNLGRLTAVQSDDYAKVLDYDAVGNLSSRSVTMLDTRKTLTVQTLASPSGQPLRVIYPSGMVVKYHYDAAGNPKLISDGAFSVTTTFAPGGRPASQLGDLKGAYGLQFDRAWDYDSKHRVKRLGTTVTKLPAKWPWTVDYEYYQNNSLYSVKDSQRGFTYVHDYDEANRLKSASGYKDAQGEPAGDIIYEYNANSSLASVQISGKTDTYSYAGTQKHLLDSISEGTSTTDGATTLTVSRDTAGQWCGAVRTGAGPFNRSYTWFRDGTLASIKHTVDGGDALITTAVAYTYDEDGRRIRSVRQAGVEPTGTVTTEFLDDLVEHTKAGSAPAISEYIAVPGGRLEIRSSGSHRVHLNDQLSTAYVVTEGSAGWEIVHATSYLPYGKKLFISGLPDVPFDFNTKRREPGIGTLYYGARHYDPEVRQWISPDPLRARGVDDAIEGANTLQPFVYAAANPTTMKDLDGKQAFTGFLRLYHRDVEITGRSGLAALAAHQYRTEIAIRQAMNQVTARAEVIGQIASAVIGVIGQIGALAEFSALSAVASGAGAKVPLGAASAQAPSQRAAAGGVARAETRIVSGATVTPKGKPPMTGNVNVGLTLDRIRSGGSFPHPNDGSVFMNKEGLLPAQSQGYYREWVHPTPGVSGPGPQRIVAGSGGELLYTPDHYKTFIPLN